MTLRLASSALFAAVVTLGLLAGMQQLTARGRRAPERIRATPIEIARPERETETDTERRRRPPPRARPPAPPDPRSWRPRPTTRPRERLDLGAALFAPELDLAIPGLGGVPSDADVSPLLRVPPQYPPRAAQRGIEGWVLVEFTVAETGAVRDVVVVDADPPHIFDHAALRAVRKWKYQPKRLNGRPVERTGVQAVLRFVQEEP